MTPLPCPAVPCGTPPVTHRIGFTLSGLVCFVTFWALTTSVRPTHASSWVAVAIFGAGALMTLTGLGVISYLNRDFCLGCGRSVWLGLGWHIHGTTEEDDCKPQSIRLWRNRQHPACARCVECRRFVRKNAWNGSDPKRLYHEGCWVKARDKMLLDPDLLSRPGVSVRELAHVAAEAIKAADYARLRDVARAYPDTQKCTLRGQGVRTLIGLALQRKDYEVAPCRPPCRWGAARPRPCAGPPPPRPQKTAPHHPHPSVFLGELPLRGLECRWPVFMWRGALCDSEAPLLQGTGRGDRRERDMMGEGSPHLRTTGARAISPQAPGGAPSLRTWSTQRWGEGVQYRREGRWGGGGGLSRQRPAGPCG